MNKTIYRFISFIVAFALACQASSRALAAAMVSGNIYYVSTTGNDSNSGSSTAPFKTFAKAISVLAPGDTLQVMPGMYYEPMVLSKSGTAAAPITVLGNGAILDVQGSEDNGIRITGNYVNVSSFEITGGSNTGIAIAGKYVTVKNNILHDNVTDNGVGTCGSADSWVSGLKVGVGGEHITIDGNIVYNNCGEGIAITRGVNVVVKNNISYDNFSQNIYIDNSPYTTVEHNLVFCTGARLGRDGTRPTGIGLGEERYENWGAQMHDVLVAGNMVRACDKGIAAFDSEVRGTLTNVTITKNYIPSGEYRAIVFTSSPNENVVISHNTLFNEPYISSKRGVTLISNIIGGGTAPTFTSISTPILSVTSGTGADQE